MLVLLSVIQAPATQPDEKEDGVDIGDYSMPAGIHSNLSSLDSTDQVREFRNGEWDTSSVRILCMYS